MLEPTTADSVLQPLGLSEKMSTKALARLSTLAASCALPEGQLLFREGERHSTIYWIKSGRVRLEMSRKHCGTKSMMTAGPGDLLAWSTVLSSGRMTATAMTVTQVTLVAFNAEELLRVCEADCQVGYPVMTCIAKAVSRRLTATRLQLLDLYETSCETVMGREPPS